MWLFVLCGSLCAVGCWLSDVYCWLIVVCGLSFDVRCVLVVGWCMLFVVRCCLLVVCFFRGLWSAVC